MHDGKQPVATLGPGGRRRLSSRRTAEGLQDELIPSQQSVLLHEALQAVGATSELELIDGAEHVFFGVDPGPIAERSADFLARQLAQTLEAAQIGIAMNGDE